MVLECFCNACGICKFSSSVISLRNVVLNLNPSVWYELLRVFWLICNSQNVYFVALWTLALISLMVFPQTGEFSARFLLKLPVDFSNIPTYLLKVK